MLTKATLRSIEVKKLFANLIALAEEVGTKLEVLKNKRLPAQEYKDEQRKIAINRVVQFKQLMNEFNRLAMPKEELTKEVKTALSKLAITFAEFGVEIE